MNENSNPAGNPRVGEPRVADKQESVRVEGSEFGRFEALTQKLVGVSKSDLDKQQRESGD